MQRRAGAIAGGRKCGASQWGGVLFGGGDGGHCHAPARTVVCGHGWDCQPHTSGDVQPEPLPADWPEVPAVSGDPGLCATAGASTIR